MDARDLPLHPFAELFPEMTPEEYARVKEDVRVNGVLEPVRVWSGAVVDGRHRRQMCIELGIPCPASEWGGKESGLLGFVVSLNVNRRHLNDSQRAMVAAKLANLKRGDNQHTEVAEISATSQTGAAEMLNVSRGSVQHARKVLDNAIPELIEAVESGRVPVSNAAILADAPREVQRLAAASTSSKVVSTMAKQFKQQQRVEREQAEAAPESDECCPITDIHALVATGQKFGCIYADPPWKYGNQATRASTDNHYSTMTIEEIAALPIGELALPKSHLWLWTTNAFLFECPRLFAAWGFEFKSSYVWVKTQMGIGNYLRNSHEILLLAVRGGLTGAARNVMSWGEFPRTQHSAKPERIRGDVVQKLSPGPYLELFGRRLVEGWTVWGNQIAAESQGTIPFTVSSRKESL